MRFTIRDLLWLTVVVTLALGWCLDRSGALDNIGVFVPIYTDEPPARVRQLGEEPPNPSPSAENPPRE